MKTKYTPEFKAYCKANGRTPAKQLAHDRRKFPGGCMCGFILWMSAKLSAFKLAHPEACIGGFVRDHKAKVRFLNAA
jgi:hypothetical protein